MKFELSLLLLLLYVRNPLHKKPDDLGSRLVGFFTVHGSTWVGVSVAYEGRKGMQQIGHAPVLGLILEILGEPKLERSETRQSKQEKQ